ncbi:MAG: RHS repeat protein [Saprospiraceae bacterium]|nr:RHS repeat protein [Saprospiraceae bacterium]
MGYATSYSYDGNGNVITRTDANGNVSSYTYDALNRLTSKNYNGNTDNYEYDANGNLTRASNNHISISFQYDALNRLREKNIETWGKTIGYEYDGAGNRSKMTDPDGGETLYSYDANNRLISITNPAGETTVFTYDNGGRLVQQNYHNGSKANFTYDAANRLLSLVHSSSSGNTIASYTYTYDNNGNRLSMTDQSGGTASYTYDGDNRLVNVTYTGIIAPNQQFELDATGNRTLLNNGGVETAYAYDDADRLETAGTTSYDFDNNGNMVQKTTGNGQTTTYQYDGENRLLRVALPNGESVDFQYDPFGNRIAQQNTSGTTRYLLDGDNVLMELDDANTTLARYTAGLSLDSWISMERNGQSYFYHTDGLGSITALTNGAQTIASTYRYDAYGNMLSQTGNVPNPYTYTGREFDAATGLYYYRTRFYDATVGRFLTRDDFPLDKNNPNTINRYLYIESNPINYVDPTGE